jgi:AraC family transcriptional regulator, arabinose operon regulatory protein
MSDPIMAKTTHFLVSLHGVPAESLRDLFLTVVRAGRLDAGPDHRIERDYYPGHELTYCRSGRGWARVRGKTFEVLPGQLLWINCHHPHAYGADPRDPWSLDWIRVEGATLDRTWNMLSADSQPVITGLDLPRCTAEVDAIFALMQDQDPCHAAWIHARVAVLIAMAFDARQTNPLPEHHDLSVPMERVLQHLRLYYHKTLRVNELAEMAGMSPSHFNRVFRSSLGSSPIDWLRHYRIAQAKRRLIESADPIKDVARQVGYADQFYFSKDFKRFTGLTPTTFRESEGNAS